ncbi:MAG: hypothetical protein Q7R92_01615, partial [bacterium]|nr:hypothetical protein [bacterium]
VGQKELLKRDIQLNFPGTQLEKEFADFLKEDGGRESGLADFYRQVSWVIQNIAGRSGAAGH